MAEALNNADLSWGQWASQVALVVENLPANVGDIEMRVPSLGWEDPLEEEGMTTHSSILVMENSMDRGVWQAHSPCGP